MSEKVVSTTIKAKKEVEGHNNKSGKEVKSWKFYDELSQCLPKDIFVKPTYTIESSSQVDELTSNPADCDSQKTSTDNESSSQSVDEGPQSSGSSGKERQALTKQI